MGWVGCVSSYRTVFLKVFFFQTPCCDSLYRCRFCHDDEQKHTLKRFVLSWYGSVWYGKYSTWNRVSLCHKNDYYGHCFPTSAGYSVENYYPLFYSNSSVNLLAKVLQCPWLVRCILVVLKLGVKNRQLAAMFRIRKFLNLPDPDPLVGGTDPDGIFYFKLFCDFCMTFFLWRMM